MENFLPALLIIGGVIYKIYTEFQKEQEKARQRKPSIPPVPQQQIPTPPSVKPAPQVDKYTAPPPVSEVKAGRYEEAYSAYQGFIPEEVKKVKLAREKTRSEEHTSELQSRENL